MTRIYMVRHGQADSAWHESPDPGLSELGRQQAATAAQQLHHLNNVHIISSPLLRCQQTAQPFAEVKHTSVSIHSEVSEIPTPSNIAFEQRGPWLQQAMGGTWQQLGQQFVDYQNTIAHFVAAFATATTFAGGAAFALNAFGALCALATAAITPTTAAIAATSFIASLAYWWLDRGPRAARPRATTAERLRLRDGLALFVIERIVATSTAMRGLRSASLHLMSKNFSAPKSAPKPASVTTKSARPMAVLVATTLLQPWAILAKGPPWIRAGLPSKVCTRLGSNASFKRAVIAPSAFKSAQVTGLWSFR
jgi:hypothetical protein